MLKGEKMGEENREYYTLLKALSCQLNIGEG